MSLITRVGDCLKDSEMTVYDHKQKKKISVDWLKKDRPMSLISTALKQKAGPKSSRTHIIHEFTPVSSQGSIGSCAANAWCDMMEILDGLDGNDKVEQLSRLFLYWISRSYTNDTDRDAGTYLRSAGHQLKNIGVVEEKYYPYEDIQNKVFKSPELDLYTMASNNRLTGFYKPGSLNPDSLLGELELAIRANHPFVFGTPVTDKFQDYRGDGTVFGSPKIGDNILGNHAMICTGVGYDGEKRWWLWRNSWGSGWGDKGHVKVNDEYILACRDFWVGTKMGEFI